MAAHRIADLVGEFTVVWKSERCSKILNHASGLVEIESDIMKTASVVLHFAWNLTGD